jgi:tetratricopeptide (TPR) repeat protein
MLAGTVLLAPPATAQPHRDAYRQATTAAEAGRTEEAYALFFQAAEGARAARDPAVVERAHRVLAQIEYNRGARLLWMGDEAAAIPYFESGLAFDPENARNLIGLGRAYDAVGRREEALRMLGAAITTADRNGQPDLRDQAEALLRRRYYDRARPYVETATPTEAGARLVLEQLDALDVLLAPDAKGSFYRASALLTLGRAGEAVAVADSALVQYRGTREGAAGLHFVRAEALLRMGRRADAWNAYQGALYEPYRRRAEARLREIRQ